ncbi:hypothetical protein A5642_13415, partial [Mycolicibacterium mucogenicum]
MVVCFAVVGIIVVMAILMGRRQPRRRAGTGRRAGAAGAYGYGYAGSDGGGWDAGGSACSDGGGSSGCGGGCGVQQFAQGARRRLGREHDDCRGGVGARHVDGGAETVDGRDDWHDATVANTTGPPVPIFSNRHHRPRRHDSRHAHDQAGDGRPVRIAAHRIA